MDVSRTIFPSIAGKIIDYRGTGLPKGFLDCTAAYLNIADYPRLYEAIGHQFDLITDTDPLKFRLPGANGKISIYAGDGFVFGESGGEETHQLTVAEMPIHTHVQNAHTHNTYQYVGGLSGGVANSNINPFASTATGTTTASNKNTGGDVPHNNIMPSAICRKIIKF